MTMRWFGESWHAPINETCPHVSTPVGEICTWCDEPVEAEDRGVIYVNGPVSHLNCFLRGVFGSVAHIEGRCSCCVPGSTCGDPEGMTLREAADAAVAAMYQRHRRPQ